jgi:hypothetical protein
MTRIILRAAVWSVTDHLCRRPVEDGGYCGGRIVLKQREPGKLFARCTRCGIESPGPAKALCMCGETIHNGKRAGADAGLRCVKNDTRTHERPDEVVIRYVALPVAVAAPKAKAKSGGDGLSGDLWPENGDD